MSSVTENNTHVYYAIVAGMIPHGGRSPVVGWEAYPYRYTIDQYNNRVYDRSVKPYPQDLPSNYQSVELVNVTINSGKIGLLVLITFMKLMVKISLS